MTWWQRFRNRDRLERELDAELRDHFDRHVEDNIRCRDARGGGSTDGTAGGRRRGSAEGEVPGCARNALGRDGAGRQIRRAAPRERALVFGRIHSRPGARDWRDDHARDPHQRLQPSRAACRDPHGFCTSALAISRAAIAACPFRIIGSGGRRRASHRWARSPEPS